MGDLKGVTAADGDATRRLGDRELEMIQHFFLAAIAGFVLSGCASEKEIMTQSTTDQTETRVHTQEELRKTGETQTGPALEKVDPAVQTSHRP